MNPTHNKANVILYLFLLYLFFLGMGIFLAYWFGLGWFFLLHTISVLLASSPRLYIPVAHLFISKESTERLKERLLGTNKHWFVPRSAIALNLLNLILTVLAFWKINTPLRMVIQAIISAK